jgi:hypothetical protein
MEVFLRFLIPFLQNRLNKSAPPRKTWMDRFISVRESLLDRITLTQPSYVLNPENLDFSQRQSSDLPARMRDVLGKIMLDVMDTQGVHVDYAALRAHPAYIDFRKKLSPSLQRFDPSSLVSDAEQIAFWINLYHVLVLDGVISFGIKQGVGEGWLGLMAFFRKAAYNIGGKRMSLNDIEHGILRRNAGHPLVPGAHFPSDDLRRAWMVQKPDPRIHFALNCASRSCPPIHIYSFEKLDDQLELATRSFLTASIKLNPAKQRILVSSIFKWYARDFGGRKGVVQFLLEHLPFDGRRAWLFGHRDSIRLSYEPYDWSLNGRRK